MTPHEMSRLEAGRWHIIQTCHIGGHIGVTETMLFHTLAGMWAATTRQWIRDQLAYLADRGLVQVERHEVKDWRATLTRHGVDLATYVTDCEPGIDRPKKYWGEGCAR